MPEPAVAQIIEADLTWIDERFQSGVQVHVNELGRITRLDPTGAGRPTLRLRNRALLPGFVNVHSHAFQRGLRGKGERFPASAEASGAVGGGTFWTWREAMYDLVKSVDEESLYALSVQAFSEMLAAGITTVGEFHYLHHRVSSELDFAFDELMLRAAADVGIRIVLLNTFYKTGGIGQPLAGGQVRFNTPNVDDYWTQMDYLHKRLRGSTQTLGAVAHSIRAVPLDDLTALHAGALKRDLPFHMHVEEQIQEVKSCEANYEMTPMALICERLKISERFTAIHCTHTVRADMEKYLAAGGNVCLCPTTEANLGDGIPAVPLMLERGAKICLGTDSNVRLSFAEEMRWLEYAQRLNHQTRGVFRDEPTGQVGARLLRIATVNGARALALDAGSIAAGNLADFFTIDLHSPSLAGCDDDTLIDAFIFGSGNGPIADVCVNGRWLTPAAQERRPAVAAHQ